MHPVIGNVCPANRKGVADFGPHETADGIPPVVLFLMPPVTFFVCRHCGCLYAEKRECKTNNF